MKKDSMRSMGARQGVGSESWKDRWWTWKCWGVCVARWTRPISGKSRKSSGSGRGCALGRGPRRCRYGDHIIQRICRHVDPISQWKKRVKPLNEWCISVKQPGYSLDDTGGINSGEIVQQVRAQNEAIIV